MAYPPALTKGKPSVALYLAGPIDDIDPADAASWRSSLQPPANVLLYTPLGAFHHVNPNNADAVDRVNRAVISTCDGLLANLAGPGRGFGTIREIEYARGLGKPVAVTAPPEGLASLLTYDLIVSPTLVGALSLLLETL